jgi:AbrB family looped-hinge helix DNA binding protein
MEMGIESKITSKGQTTIPLEVRDYLHLGVGDRIRYEFENGKVVIVPKNRSALELAGILYDPNRRPVSVEEMEEAIGDGIVEDYERSLDRG